MAVLLANQPINPGPTTPRVDTPVGLGAMSKRGNHKPIPLVTATLILVNLLTYTYLITRAETTQLALVKRYGLTLNGLNPTQVFTHIWIHANLAHLATNMFFLLIFGVATEEKLGHVKTLLAYLLSGLVGGLTHLATAPGDSIGIGASGAVFGLMGASLLANPLKTYMLVPTGLLAMLFTLAEITAIEMGVTPNVGHQAHIGGLVAGSTATLVMNPKLALKGILVSVSLLLIILFMLYLFEAILPR